VKRVLTDHRQKWLELHFEYDVTAFQVMELCAETESHIIDRSKLEDLLKQRFFYDQAFSIYQGVAGLFDYGPMGCAMKANLLTAWRHFFVLEEQMLEVDSCMLTPEIVLKLVFVYKCV